MYNKGDILKIILSEMNIHFKLNGIKGIRRFNIIPIWFISKRYLIDNVNEILDNLVCILQFSNKCMNNSINIILIKICYIIFFNS